MVLKPQFPRVYITLAILYISLGSIYYAFHDKGFTVLAVNNLHHPLIEPVFVLITHLGSGWLLACAFLTALFLQFRLAIKVLIIAVFQGLVMLVFKVYLFPNEPRPLTYFEDLSLERVEGIAPVFLRSFPSGHSMTAFSICMLVAYYLHGPRQQIALFAMASLIAFSRVYLAFHFLIDTTAGAFFGIASTFLGIYMVNNTSSFQGAALDKRIHL